MTTPRTFANYPPHYAQLFMDAVDGPIQIKGNSPADVRTHRSHLYAFRSAALSELPDGHEELLLLLPEARTRIEGNTLTVFYNDIHRKLKDALTNSGTSRVPVKD